MFQIKSKDANGNERTCDILSGKELDDYFEGKNCSCYAICASECCCSEADWTPLAVYKLRWHVFRLQEVIKTDIANERMTVSCDSDWNYIEYLENLLKDTQL